MGLLDVFKQVAPMVAIGAATGGLGTPVAGAAATAANSATTAATTAAQTATKTAAQAAANNASTAAQTGVQTTAQQEALHSSSVKLKNLENIKGTHFKHKAVLQNSNGAPLKTPGGEPLNADFSSKPVGEWGVETKGIKEIGDVSVMDPKTGLPLKEDFALYEIKSAEGSKYVVAPKEPGFVDNLSKGFTDFGNNLKENPMVIVMLAGQALESIINSQDA